MKIIDIYPNEIIIQENLSHTIENNFSRFEYYLKLNEEVKYVITYLYQNYLIAIDGNKLCTIYRVLNTKISVIVLESENDFKEFHKEYRHQIGSDRLYSSRLLNWENINKLEEVLSLGYIIEKDYFHISRYQVDLQNCLNVNFNYYFNHEIPYVGLTNNTKKLLGIKN